LLIVKLPSVSIVMPCVRAAQQGTFGTGMDRSVKFNVKFDL
jgi:hypothetical protein